jgi:hypothetical protein
MQLIFCPYLISKKLNVHTDKKKASISYYSRGLPLKIKEVIRCRKATSEDRVTIQNKFLTLNLCYNDATPMMIINGQGAVKQRENKQCTLGGGGDNE